MQAGELRKKFVQQPAEMPADQRAVFALEESRFGHAGICRRARRRMGGDNSPAPRPARRGLPAHSLAPVPGNPKFSRSPSRRGCSARVGQGDPRRRERSRSSERPRRGSRAAPSRNGYAGNGFACRCGRGGSYLFVLSALLLRPRPAADKSALGPEREFSRAASEDKSLAAGRSL